MKSNKKSIFTNKSIKKDNVMSFLYILNFAPFFYIKIYKINKIFRSKL